MLKVIEETKFIDRNVNVSVFESIIRIIGPLLSIHQIIDDKIPSYYKEPLLNEEDKDKILNICSRLADKILFAFDTTSDIPHPIINLKHGVVDNEFEIDTLVSSAGTSLIEFYYLSLLTNSGRYRGAAENAAITLYHKRHKDTQLLGSRLSVSSGEWLDPRTSIAGNADSFLEYMAKYPNVLKHKNTKLSKRWNTKWKHLYNALNQYSNFGKYWVDVHMGTGKVIYPYSYSLGAFWPSVLVLTG